MNDIKKFFNKNAFNRNQIIQSKPIVAYEQKVRSKTVISMLSPGVNEKFLEVGCGSGRDIEHIPDYEKAISEMARVLKPSGCLILSTPSTNSIYGFERYVLMEKILKKKWPHPLN